MNEDELKNALHEAAPEGPSPDGWAAAARGRAVVSYTHLTLPTNREV